MVAPVLTAPAFAAPAPAVPLPASPLRGAAPAGPGGATGGSAPRSDSPARTPAARSGEIPSASTGGARHRSASRGSATTAPTATSAPSAPSAAPGPGATATAGAPVNPVVELVGRAQQGDSEAFGRLYDHYSDTVYRYIYYRVGSRATAEDLTSETFLRALRRIGTFTWQGRDFGAWLVTIARNLVADHFKSSRFRLEVTTGEMLDANEVERSPEESVLESLSNAALLEAVRRLNPQQQECVTLRFLQGLSVAETARIMGKNEGAIKTLQYRAVRTLARLLPSDAR
ncbi:ECF subfamily RNA polymerase sigma factor, BldN family [Phaeacidiphilus oryzae]|uniref:ECF subfamily RNA polymerase sigma factor, BldN family n=1 Tax=Phaeacidiphilus oryzae TaxID=348818 RepID=UPI000A0150F4|nr:ECF subfamily RNA polymerase sigma factor, BldN family [Phaeacidiphilus oryzae]